MRILNYNKHLSTKSCLKYKYNIALADVGDFLIGPHLFGWENINYKNSWISAVVLEWKLVALWAKRYQ